MLVALTGGCLAPGTSPWGPAGCANGTCGQTTQYKPAAQNSEGGLTVRGQTPGAYQPYASDPYAAGPNSTMPGSPNYLRGPQPVSGGAPQTTYPPAGYAPPQNQPSPANYAYQPPAGGAPPLPPPPAEAFPGSGPFTPAYPGFQPPSNFPDVSATPTPLDVIVSETRTGKFMFGVAVNSDAGVTGQITIHEQNFDISRPPTSWEDVLNGTAWRGAGQSLRIEAQPGTQVQRYLVSFTDPYFLESNVSFSASAFYFDRNYFDWDESRLGGRLGWGYRLTPDLSISGTAGAQSVNIFNPRVLAVPELNAALGKSELYSGRATLTHDTRDLPFMPTEGHMIELAYEQTFGSFEYPRFEAEYAQYFMLRQRPDMSGRHTLAFSTRVGISGDDTPIFENYFAGGFSTLRGYAFRGASPIDTGVRVGGQFRWLNSVEYFFPISADDMIRGTLFCDFGTVERDIAFNEDNFRIAPGFGLRLNVPAMGPAPLAFDFAFPMASAPGDEEQSFSFFFGATR